VIAACGVALALRRKRRKESLMTPAIRAVEAAKIAFTLHRYDHDPRAESFGEEAAGKLGLSPERVFKTLVARLDGKELVLAVVAASSRLDLKKLAAAAGGKKADMADATAAERATGYVVGGISPIAGRKRLPLFLDESALTYQSIFVSAGQRGLQMELSPSDLLRLTGGTTAAIASC
jgi:Cys-tRNA(Pro)/Cys-tRNA(Cys) deacylase